MPGVPFVSGEQVSLHTIDDEDVEFIHEEINRPEIRRPAGLRLPQSRDAVRGVLDSDEESVALLVCADEGPVGMVTLRDVDHYSKMAETGIWISPDCQGSGYAQEATDLVVEYAFRDLALRRVEAKVLASNEAAMGSLESVGFTHEGTLRRRKFVDGEYHDVEVYGLLADERT